MTFCRSWMLKAMPKRNLGQKELCPILTQLRKTADGVWWEVSLIPHTRTHLHLHRRRGGGGCPAKGIPITAIHLFAPSPQSEGLELYTSCYNQLQKCWDTPTKKWPFLLQIAAGHRSVRYNTDFPPPSQSKLFLHKGQRNITSTRSWTGHLCQSQVLLQLVVAFTWAPHKFFSNNF